MAFVLDGLHEDLNRIKNKPYFADNDEDENKSDEELAKLQWDQYKARNDSIIVDKIHGQIKSTLTCPTCMKISIKFDPICFLSLPLPIPEKQFEQMFLLMQPDKKWALFAMKVTRSTTVPEATKIIQDDLAKSIEYKEKPIVLWKMDERQNVQFLRADDTVAINNSYSSYHQQQHHNKIYGIFVDSPEQQLMVVVKNQSVSNERPVTLPYVFAISPGVEINREWVDNVAMPTIRSEFFKDPQLVHDADEGVPYEVLIIHLKRFIYDRWHREKIGIQVQIPSRGLELNDKLANDKHEHVQYDLIGMSHHYGVLAGGHYKATGLNPNGKWYEFNDSSVHEIAAPDDPYISDSPYLLVYQRRASPDVHHVDENIAMEVNE
ncbi:unnamed protein product, partial [Mesorhabditis spiculigera]